MSLLVLPLGNKIAYYKCVSIAYLSANDTAFSLDMTESPTPQQKRNNVTAVGLQCRSCGFFSERQRLLHSVPRGFTSYPNSRSISLPLFVWSSTLSMKATNTYGTCINSSTEFTGKHKLQIIHIHNNCMYVWTQINFVLCPKKITCK